MFFDPGTIVVTAQYQLAGAAAVPAVADVFQNIGEGILGTWLYEQLFGPNAHAQARAQAQAHARDLLHDAEARVGNMFDPTHRHITSPFSGAMERCGGRRSGWEVLCGLQSQRHL